MRISRAMTVNGTVGLLLVLLATVGPADVRGQTTKPAAGQDAQAEARERLRKETNEILYVFGGTVDIYLTVKGADQPVFAGAEIHRLDRVADYAYYTVKTKDGSFVRIPPSQILMVRQVK